MLLEAHRLGALQLNDAALLPGLNLTLSFREQEEPDDTPAEGFWREKFLNGSWQQYPTNIAAPIQIMQPIAPLLDDWCDAMPCICPWVEPFVEMVDSLSDFLSAFGIPADTDDSSVNLA